MTIPKYRIYPLDGYGFHDKQILTDTTGRSPHATRYLKRLEARDLARLGRRVNLSNQYLYYHE